MLESAARIVTPCYRMPPNDHPGKTHLHLNENLFAATREANARAVASIPAACFSDLHAYPRNGAAPLQSVIALHLSLADDAIVVGPGSTFLLQHLGQLLLREGDTMLVPDPSWGFYDTIAQTAGARIARFPLRDLDTGFVYDTDSIHAHIEQHAPTLVLLCSPNNPTGSSLAPAAVLELVERHPDTLFVLDQAYHGFNDDPGSDVVEAATRRHNLVLVRSFSKFLGLANLRVGYLICHRATAERLRSLTPVFGLPSFVQTMAADRIADLDLHARIRREFAEVRDWFCKEVEAIPGLTPCRTEANFVLVRHDSRWNDLDTLLLDAGFVVKRVKLRNASNHLRITLADRPTMERVVRVLRDARGRPMHLTVRQGNEQDWSAIARLNHDIYCSELGQHRTNPERVKTDRLHGSNVYFVAYDGDLLIGMVSVTKPGAATISTLQRLPPDHELHACTGDAAEVRLLAVRPEYRGRGVYDRIVLALMRYCNQEGIHRILISAIRNNVRLYAAMGFRPVGEPVQEGAAVYQPMQLTRADFEDSKYRRRTLACLDAN